MEAFENGENKASDIHSIDFPFICRICLRRGDLRLFEQEDYLLDLFVTITKIDVRSAVNFPSNICNECINELEDISLFIDIAKYNDSRPGKNVIPKKENEFVAIVDFGTSQEPVVKAEKSIEEYGVDIVTEKSEMCRICLVPSCLTPFEEKAHLMQLFQNITNIDLGAASNFSNRNRICDKCINKLESISLFISLSSASDMKIEVTIGRNGSLKTDNCLQGNAINISSSKSLDMEFDNISDKNEVKFGNYSNESKDLHTVIDIKEEILRSPKAALRENDQKGLELCSKTESDPYEKEFSSETRPKIISKVSSEAHLRTKQFKGNFCKKKFNQRKLLKLHSLTHIMEKLFKCDICKKYFRLKGDLNRHMLTHTGEKSFECDSCGKSFSRNQNLKRHMVTHTGEKPFICDSCQKGFGQKGALNRHMLIHTGEKPFTCDMCQKSFGMKSILIEHFRTHTGEKPFKCDSCLKGFVRVYNLKKHMLAHTGEKPFECDSCFRGFTRLNHMKEHMLTHTGEKPFECDCCKKKFTRLHHLKRHMLTHTVEKTCAKKLSVEKLI